MSASSISISAMGDVPSDTTTATDASSSVATTTSATMTSEDGLSSVLDDEPSSEIRGLDEDDDDEDEMDSKLAESSSVSSSALAKGRKQSDRSSGTSTTLGSMSTDKPIISRIISCCQEKGAKSYQEDSTCVCYSDDLSVLMACVFDGHGGLNGQVASQCVSKLTQEWFKVNWRNCHKWEEIDFRRELTAHLNRAHEAIRECFIELEKSRRRHSRFGSSEVVDSKGIVRKASRLPVHGGTTGTIVIVVRKRDADWRVVCANVGDSDSLLLARKPATLDRSHAKCVHLSVDHSPDNSAEYLRIKALPNSQFPKKLLFVYDQMEMTRKYECPLVFLEDGTKDPKYVKNPWGYRLRPTNVRYDPAVYAVSPAGVTQDVTCIAMTRSLGDFYAQQFGLTNECDVTVMDLPSTQTVLSPGTSPTSATLASSATDTSDATSKSDVSSTAPATTQLNCEYIISVGSDGIWDCWKWEDFSDYVNGELTKQKDDLGAVCKNVLSFTVARAKACFGAGSFDDASLALIALNPCLFPPLSSDESDIDADTRVSTDSTSSISSSSATTVPSVPSS